MEAIAFQREWNNCGILASTRQSRFKCRDCFVHLIDSSWIAIVFNFALVVALRVEYDWIAPRKLEPCLLAYVPVTTRYEYAHRHPQDVLFMPSSRCSL